jgi:hypothetical protein
MTPSEYSKAFDPTNFEGTSRYAYMFAKTVVLPLVEQMPEAKSGDPFLLRTLVFKVTDEKLTEGQLQSPTMQSSGIDAGPMRPQIRFWAHTIANNSGLYVNLGKGLFRLATEADFNETEAIDEAISEDAEDEELSEYGGSVYAFSFPMIVKQQGAFPIKVGKTIGSVDDRVAIQAKGSAAFEPPVILGQWKVNRVGPAELAVHNILKSRGKWREQAPGTEWFDTTVSEIEAIIKFITEA